MTITTPPRTSRHAPRHATLLMLATLLLGGCGELALKRGASQEDLAAARQACREQAADPAAQRRCLADKGWFIQDWRAQSPADGDPVIDVAALASDSRMENAAVHPAPSGTATAAAASSSSSPPTPAPARDPLDRFKVGAWWKLGGNGAGLRMDTEACVAQLGEAHRPDSQTLLATRALLSCLKEKGWSGLRTR